MSDEGKTLAAGCIAGTLVILGYILVAGAVIGGIAFVALEVFERFTQ